MRMLRFSCGDIIAEQFQWNLSFLAQISIAPHVITSHHPANTSQLYLPIMHSLIHLARIMRKENN